MFKGVIELFIAFGVDQVVARRYTENRVFYMETVLSERISLPHQRHVGERFARYIKLTNHALW